MGSRGSCEPHTFYLSTRITGQFYVDLTSFPRSAAAIRISSVDPAPGIFDKITVTPSPSLRLLLLAEEKRNPRAEPKRPVHRAIRECARSPFRLRSFYLSRGEGGEGRGREISGGGTKERTAESRFPDDKNVNEDRN